MIKLKRDDQCAISVSGSSQVDGVAFWIEEISNSPIATFSEKYSRSSAGSMTIISAASRNSIRTLLGLSFQNNGGSSQTISVAVSIGGVSKTILQCVLGAKESLHYSVDRGWYKLNSSGELPGSSSSSPSVSIGGSNTQIQFNDNDAFGGDADLTWNKTTNKLTLGGTDTGIVLAGITNEPSAPASGNLILYSKEIAGRMTPKIVGPSGIDTPLQNALWQNNTVIWTPTTATAGVWQGSAGAGAGTYTTALPTTTNLYTAMKRGRWANVVTTANQVLGQRNTEAMFFLGNSAGMGGFSFYARFGFDVWTNGGRLFAGMHTGTTVVSANPSALNNTCGFCVDDSDNGAISFLTRGTSATKTPTGITLSNNRGYDINIFAAPNSSVIKWRIIDFVNGVEVSGTANSNIPAANTMFTAGVLASNAALTTATAIHLGLNRIYVETDR